MFFTVKETHVVALEMAPTLAIKTATSIGMCVLTVCTIDLVCAERKKILMFSSTVWARAWFVAKRYSSYNGMEWNGMK